MANPKGNPQNLKPWPKGVSGNPAGGKRKPWRDEVDKRSPKAFAVLDEALDGKVKNGYKYAAAKDLLAWADPDRNKQQHVLTGTVQWVVTIGHRDPRDIARMEDRAPAGELPPGRRDG